MSYGYTLRLRDANLEADQTLLGVRLGKLCIENGISVVATSKQFGVTRATIYNWFSGKTEPCKVLHADVQRFIETQSQRLTA
jgi:hypothetical protein